MLPRPSAIAWLLTSVPVLGSRTGQLLELIMSVRILVMREELRLGIVIDQCGLYGFDIRRWQNENGRDLYDRVRMYRAQSEDSSPYQTSRSLSVLMILAAPVILTLFRVHAHGQVLVAGR